MFCDICFPSMCPLNAMSHVPLAPRLSNSNRLNLTQHLIWDVLLVKYYITEFSLSTCYPPGSPELPQPSVPIAQCSHIPVFRAPFIECHCFFRKDRNWRSRNWRLTLRHVSTTQCLRLTGRQKSPSGHFLQTTIKRSIFIHEELKVLLCYVAGFQRDGLC